MKGQWKSLRMHVSAKSSTLGANSQAQSKSYRLLSLSTMLGGGRMSFRGAMIEVKGTH